LAMHKDINKLVLQSGHTSVDTMWRHYHRGTTEAEAKKFWAIMPPEGLQKLEDQSHYAQTSDDN